jgi:hypothetical protein
MLDNDKNLREAKSIRVGRKSRLYFEASWRSLFFALFVKRDIAMIFDMFI